MTAKTEVTPSEELFFQFSDMSSGFQRFEP